MCPRTTSSPFPSPLPAAARRHTILASWYRSKRSTMSTWTHSPPFLGPLWISLFRLSCHTHKGPPYLTDLHCVLSVKIFKPVFWVKTILRQLLGYLKLTFPPLWLFLDLSRGRWMAVSACLFPPRLKFVSSCLAQCRTWRILFSLNHEWNHEKMTKGQLADLWSLLLQVPLPQSVFSFILLCCGLHSLLSVFVFFNDCLLNIPLSSQLYLILELCWALNLSYWCTLEIIIQAQKAQHSLDQWAISCRSEFSLP